MNNGISVQTEEVWTTAGLVKTADRPVAEIKRVEAMHEATVGEPAPMALFGFAVGTLLAGLVLTGDWPTATLMAVIPMLLWFAGVGQFIGGLFGLAKGNTFAGTAFCSFGAGNVIIGSFLWMQSAGLIGRGTADFNMLGIALLCLGYIALMLVIASLRTNAVYTAVLGTLTAGYILSGLPYLGASTVVGSIGGWCLVASAVLAFYAGGAVVVNSQWQREVIPVLSYRR